MSSTTSARCKPRPGAAGSDEPGRHGFACPAGREGATVSGADVHGRRDHRCRRRCRRVPVGAHHGAGRTGREGLSWRFVRHELAPDVGELADGRPADRLEGRDQIGREAAILIVGYAFGYSLLAFDLMMALAHKWVSNLFGAFYFMGSFLAALMGLAILTIVLRRVMGLAQLVSPKQLHDLGKLCFGFTVFWAYLMWSQFLVIWYGNLPEETYFIFYRLIGPWRPVGIAVFLLVVLLRFVGRLGATPKKYPPTFLAFALVSLAGIWLERYLEIVPSINGWAGVWRAVARRRRTAAVGVAGAAAARRRPRRLARSRAINSAL